jgi:hypothetical protein
MSPELFAAVFVVGMFCGVFIIFMGLRQRSQQLEMHHRERMAMIERGQIPLNEPASHYHDKRPAIGGAARASRSMSIGIIIVGIGLALMIIIGVAAESPEVGIGVGGAIAILGAAFIALSLVARPQIPPPSSEDRV